MFQFLFGKGNLLSVKMSEMSQGRTCRLRDDRRLVASSQIVRWREGALQLRSPCEFMLELRSHIPP